MVLKFLALSLWVNASLVFFKVIFHYKKRYYRKVGFYSGLKHFRCIDKNSDVTKMLDQVKKSKKGARSISTFDFTTIYTKIPHNELIELLCKLVDTTFNDTTWRLIAVGEQTCILGSKNPTFDADKVKECLTFLIRNAYFCVGDRVFRQVIGIPM